MENFTNTNLKEAREAIQKHLDAAAEELGINLSMGSITYSDDIFRVKVTGVAAQEGGTTLTPDALAYNKNKTTDMYDLGDQVEFENKIWTIMGWKTRAKKNRLMAKNERGTTYRIPDHVAYKNKPGEIG